MIHLIFAKASPFASAAAWEQADVRHPTVDRQEWIEIRKVIVNHFNRLLASGRLNARRWDQLVGRNVHLDFNVDLDHEDWPLPPRLGQLIDSAFHGISATNDPRSERSWKKLLATLQAGTGSENWTSRLSTSFAKKSVLVYIYLMEPVSKEGQCGFEVTANSLGGAQFSTEMYAIASLRRELTARLQRALNDLLSGRVPVSVAVDHCQEMATNARDLNLQLVMDGAQSDSGQVVQLRCRLGSVDQAVVGRPRRSKGRAEGADATQWVVELVDAESQEVVATFANKWPQGLRFVDAAGQRLGDFRDSGHSAPSPSARREPDVNYVLFEPNDFFSWFHGTQKTMTNDERRKALQRWLRGWTGKSLNTEDESRDFAIGVRGCAKSLNLKFHIWVEEEEMAAQDDDNSTKDSAAREESCIVVAAQIAWTRRAGAPTGTFYFRYSKNGCEKQTGWSTTIPTLTLCEPLATAAAS